MMPESVRSPANAVRFTTGALQPIQITVSPAPSTDKLPADVALILPPSAAVRFNMPVVVPILIVVPPAVVVRLIVPPTPLFAPLALTAVAKVPNAGAAVLNCATAIVTLPPVCAAGPLALAFRTPPPILKAPKVLLRFMVPPFPDVNADAETLPAEVNTKPPFWLFRVMAPPLPVKVPPSAVILPLTPPTPTANA